MWLLLQELVSGPQKKYLVTGTPNRLYWKLVMGIWNNKKLITWVLRHLQTSHPNLQERKLLKLCQLCRIWHWLSRWNKTTWSCSSAKISMDFIEKAPFRLIKYQSCVVTQILKFWNHAAKIAWEISGPGSRTHSSYLWVEEILIVCHL
jgi:hypothetical protein